jgi:prepilin-type N-terminal cleavage/methylation domain-containing protein
MIFPHPHQFVARQQDRARSHQRAMTLVEILIVVSIIVMLATLVIPMIGFIKTHARQVACQNNLRQIGAAIHVYAGFHGNLAPSSRNWGSVPPAKSIAWFHRLPPLMSERTVGQSGGNYWQCPQFNGQGAGILNNEIPKSYKMNAKIDEERGNYSPYQFGLIKDAADIPLMLDATTSGGMSQWGHAPISAVDDSRHFGWISVLYADGRTTRVQKRSSQGWEKDLQWTSKEW